MINDETSGREQAGTIEKRLRLPITFLVAMGIYDTAVFFIFSKSYPPACAVFIFAFFAVYIAAAWGISRRKSWGRILGIILSVLSLYSGLDSIYKFLTAPALENRFYFGIYIIIGVTSLLSTIVLVKSSTAFQSEKPRGSSFAAPDQRVKPPRPLPSWLDPTLVSATAATLTYIIVGTCPGLVGIALLSEYFCSSVDIDSAGARGLVLLLMLPFLIVFLLGGLLGFFVNRYMLSHRESFNQRSIAIRSGVLVGMVCTVIGLWVLLQIWCQA